MLLLFVFPYFFFGVCSVNNMNRNCQVRTLFLNFLNTATRFPEQPFSVPSCGRPIHVPIIVGRHTQSPPFGCQDKMPLALVIVRTPTWRCVISWLEQQDSCWHSIICRQIFFESAEHTAQPQAEWHSCSTSSLLLSLHSQLRPHLTLKSLLLVLLTHPVCLSPLAIPMTVSRPTKLLVDLVFHLRFYYFSNNPFRPYFLPNQGFAPCFTILRPRTILVIAPATTVNVSTGS